MQTIKKLFITYFCLVLCFVFSLVCVNLIPKSAINEHVKVSAQTLRKVDLLDDHICPLFSQVVADNFTDALMLNLCLSVNEDSIPTSILLSPYHEPITAKTLYDVAYNKNTDTEPHSYSRYWHGYIVPLRILLVFMPYHQIRIFNYLLVGFLLALTIILMWRKISHSSAIIFGVLASLIFAYAPYNMQNTTCPAISLIAMATILSMSTEKLKSIDIRIFFFIIGAITSYFDFLTMPSLTLGLPLLCYIMRTNPSNKCKLIVSICAMWGLGYVGLWATKWILTEIFVDGNAITIAFHQFMLRSGIDTHGDNSSLSKTRIGHLLITHPWGTIIALVICILVYVYFAKSKEIIKQNIYLLLIAAIVPVWFCVAHQHSTSHLFLTWRTFLLPALSLSIFIYNTTRLSKS